MIGMSSSIMMTSLFACRIIPTVAANIDAQEFLHERRKSNIIIDKR